MCVYLNVERSTVNSSSKDEESGGKMGQYGTVGAQMRECSTVANLLLQAVLNVFQGKKRENKISSLDMYLNRKTMSCLSP